MNAIFLDIQRAYDHVNNGILLSQMRWTSFTNAWVKWIYGLLGERYVILKDADRTVIRYMTQRTRQGSVLSPLLFNVFTTYKGCQYTFHAQYINILMTSCSTCWENHKQTLSHTKRDRHASVSTACCKITLQAKKKLQTSFSYVKGKTTAWCIYTLVRTVPLHTHTK